jgi:hypothetical protein
VFTGGAKELRCGTVSLKDKHLSKKGLVNACFLDYEVVLSASFSCYHVLYPKPPWEAGTWGTPEYLDCKDERVDCALSMHP